MIACDPSITAAWRNSEPWHSTSTDELDGKSTAVTYIAEPESDADEKERHDADAIDQLRWRNQAWKWAEESATDHIDAMVSGSLVIRNRGPPARRPPRR